MDSAHVVHSSMVRSWDSLRNVKGSRDQQALAKPEEPGLASVFGCQSGYNTDLQRYQVLLVMTCTDDGSLDCDSDSQHAGKQRGRMSFEHSSSISMTRF